MSKTPILFIHGHTLDSRMWQPQLEVFKDYVTLAPTLHGYGISKPPTQSFSFAEDICTLIEPFNQVHLVGLSLGGNIALEIAIRYPEKIQTLALLDSSLKGFTPDEAQIKAGQMVQLAFDQHGLEAAKQIWLGLPLFMAARENPAIKTQLEAWVRDYSGWHWAQNISPSVAIEDVSSRLAEITAKTLIVVGEQDVAYFQNVARYLHQQIVGSKLEVVANAGHMVNLEQATVINQLLAEHFPET
jgi:3-oxoadipate enol-lactonase